MMMARLYLLLLAVAAGMSLTTAFVVPTTNAGQQKYIERQEQKYIKNNFKNNLTNNLTNNQHKNKNSNKSRTKLHMEWEDLSPLQIEARSNFFIWFFGASGAAGIARSAFPKMYNNVMEIRNLGDAFSPNANAASTEMVGLSPLCGYPRDLTVADLTKVVMNPLTIDRMVTKFPIEGNFLSKKGYITYEAFQRGNAAADPLAVRAVFDCFAQSTEVCNPEIAQAKLDKYRQMDDGNNGINAVKADLLYSKFVGWAAILTLLSLLGLADYESYNFAYTGWFPEWPGGRLWLEGGLFDPATGPWTIPNYWI